MTIYFRTQDKEAYDRILGLMGAASLRCEGATSLLCDNGEVRVHEELHSGTVMNRKITHCDAEADAWTEFFSGKQLI